MAKYSEEFKKQLVEKFEHGTSIKDLHVEYGVSESTLRNWTNKYASVKGILNMKKQEVDNKHINVKVDQTIKLISKLEFKHKVLFKEILKSLYAVEEDSNSNIEVKRQTLESFELSDELSEEQLMEKISAILYDNFVQSINVIKELVGQTKEDNVDALVINCFKNFEDAANRDERYKEKVREISKKLFSLYKLESESEQGSEYVVKYITPILIPLLHLDVDILKFGNELSSQQLAFYLEEAYEQATELLEFYEDEQDKTNAYFEELNNLTFKEKLNFVDNHIQQVIEFSQRNKTLFNTNELINLDKITSLYKKLVDKNKKKDLKEFLIHYIYNVVNASLTFDLQNSELPYGSEITYINYFIDLFIQRGVIK